jgi:hypothetical protein
MGQAAVVWCGTARGLGACCLAFWQYVCWFIALMQELDSWRTTAGALPSAALQPWHVCESDYSCT